MRYAEIGNFQAVCLFVPHDIGRLDITMHDITGMCVTKALSRALDQVENLVDRQQVVLV